MVKNKDLQFFMANLKMKRKEGQRDFDLQERGFEPQIFPPMISIFMESEGDKIKSWQGS